MVSSASYEFNAAKHKE